MIQNASSVIGKQIVSRSIFLQFVEVQIPVFLLRLLSILTYLRNDDIKNKQ